MFDPIDFDRTARDAKEAAERKAITDVIQFELESQALSIEQHWNRPFRPLVDVPADMQTSDEGSWLASRHNPNR